MTILGGPVQRASVSLRVSGPDLDPAEITKGLGCEPSYTHLSGDAIPGTNNTRKASMWALRLQTSDSLEEQLEQLTRLVPVDVAVWRKVVRDLKADVFCGVYLATDNEGVQIEPETLAWLAERGLSLGLDIYFDPDDEDESDE